MGKVIEVPQGVWERTLSYKEWLDDCRWLEEDKTVMFSLLTQVAHDMLTVPVREADLRY